MGLEDIFSGTCGGAALNPKENIGHKLQGDGTRDKNTLQPRDT